MRMPTSPVYRPSRMHAALLTFAAAAFLLSGFAPAALAAGAGNPLRTAILTGAESGGEFDAAVQSLGWPADKFSGSPADLARLMNNLKAYDLILGGPGLRLDLPEGVGADALRDFMKAGGAIVLTGATQADQLDWLTALDPKLAVLAEPPAKKEGKTPVVDFGNPPHQFRVLPGKPVESGAITAQFKPKNPNAWELVARVQDQLPCILMCRVGKGFVLVTTLRYQGADFLESVRSMLALQRMGVRYITTRHDYGGKKEPALGRGVTSVVIKNTGETNSAIEAVLRMDNGRESRTFRGNAKPKAGQQVDVQVFAMNDLRGKIRTELILRDMKSGDEERVSASEIALPEFLTVVPPAYRGLLSEARRDKNVHFKVRLAPVAENVEGMPITLAIADSKGKVISEKELAIAVPEFPVVMDLPADAPAGDYAISAVVKRSASILETAKASFKIVPVRPGQVFVDQDAVILKDGKPFFPLGLYHVSASEIEAAAATGINMCQFWHWDGNETNLNRLARAGIKAIWEDSSWGLAVRRDPAFSREPARLATVAAAWKGHPALGMWYIADEPSASNLPELRAINSAWHAADEDHPTYLVCASGEMKELQDATDVFAVDSYPVYFGSERSLTLLSDTIDSAWAAVDYRKPVIAVPQAFGNNDLHHEKPEQVRCMAYLSLVHGVRGLIWYCWKQTGGPDGEGVGYHPETLKVLTDVIAEAKVLAPALMEPGRRMLKSDDGRVHAMLCGSPATGTHLLLVNGSGEPSEALLRLPELGAGKALSGLFGAADESVKDGVLKLTVGPLATRAYLVK